VASQHERIVAPRADAALPARIMLAGRDAAVLITSSEQEKLE
jgi:hypothetical protein